MVILMYLGPSAIEAKYNVGGQSFTKTIPNGAAVAMKGLDNSSQIANRDYLVSRGVTIYNYDSGEYYGRNTNTVSIPASGGSLQYIFVGNNQKQSFNQTVASTGWSGSTTASGITISMIGAPASGVTQFVTYQAPANLLANGQVSATTIGSGIYVSFSGATCTTTNWYQAILSGIPSMPYLSFNGSVLSGTSTSTLGAGGTVNLGYSANTPTAGFINLRKLV